jgi:glycosyl transferase family 25
MKIFVINLLNSKERYEKISKNLNELELKHTRFEAVNGKELSDNELENYATYFARNFLCNKGMIGCALSHIKLWKNFLNSEDDFVLISEDDVEYNINIKYIINNINSIYESTNFDILSLNTSVGIFNSFKKSVYIDNFEFNKPIFPLTTASYILSKKGARELLKRFDKVNYHIDFLIALKTGSMEYYALKTPTVLNTSYSVESTLKTNNNGGILNRLFNIIGFHKLNWLFSNTLCCLFMHTSISVYSAILIIGALIVYKYNKLLFIIIIIELILSIYF